MTFVEWITSDRVDALIEKFFNGLCCVAALLGVVTILVQLAKAVINYG